VGWWAGVQTGLEPTLLPGPLDAGTRGKGRPASEEVALVSRLARAVLDGGSWRALLLRFPGADTGLTEQLLLLLPVVLGPSRGYWSATDPLLAGVTPPSVDLSPGPVISPTTLLRPQAPLLKLPPIWTQLFEHTDLPFTDACLVGCILPAGYR